MSSHAFGPGTGRACAKLIESNFALLASAKSAARRAADEVTPAALAVHGCEHHEGLRSPYPDGDWACGGCGHVEPAGKPPP